MTKIACIFPGQGSQYVGMGKDLFATSWGNEVLETGKRVLGEEFIRVLFEGPDEELKKTANTQPAILLTSAAAWQGIQESGLQPDYFAGHSLGEYSAYVAAGSISLAEALSVVRRRGELMQAAVPEGQGAMAAILGLETLKVVEACEKARAETGGIVGPANYNSPGQIVISGETDAVQKACQYAKELGAKRAMPLAVSGPFHSPLMKDVGRDLRPVLESINWQQLSAPVISNIDAAEVTDLGVVVESLVRQVSGAVLWEQTIRHLGEQGVDTFIELGPGKVLTGLVKKILPGVTLLNVEDLTSLEKLLAYLKESR
ncbi:ACP S-malonyltransferase [Desulfitobacterium sp. THU1]|uniref:ACP S-malonyltransferase n=1 Tax=Desulfitobacterium sp. THU1 TaxID=3138072 RepID=UPI00311F12CD